MKNYRLLILIGLISATAVNAQDADQTSFSLTEAEEYAVNNSLKVVNAGLNYDKAEKQVWQTTSIGLPQVSAQGDFQNLVHIPTQVVDATLFNPYAQPGEVMEFQMGQKYSTGLTFSVSQLLFDGSYFVGLKFSKFYMNMFETGLNQSKKDVQSMTREAYYNVLIAEKNLELMDSILVSTEEILNKTRIFYDNGLIEEEEVSQLELSYNRVKNSRDNGARQIEIGKTLLKLQMGYDLQKEIELSDKLEDVIREIESQAISTEIKDVTTNSNYVMLSQKTETDRFQLKRDNWANYPSLGAFFTHAQNAYRNEFNFFDDLPWYPTTIWGLQLNVPITSSGRRIAKSGQTKIQIEQDENDLIDLERSLKFQAHQLNASLLSAYETMLIEAENVALSKKIYDNALKRKEIGKISSLVVTQLQTQVMTAEANYIGAVMQVLQLKVQIDKLYNK